MRADAGAQGAGLAGRHDDVQVLEIGTGVGTGLAWLVHGLGARRDVEVVTVELDDEVQRTARSAPWPPWVRFESGDGAEIVGRLGQFDLIFPDAPGGKIYGLRRTVAALRPGGVLVVDDPPIRCVWPSFFLHRLCGNQAGRRSQVVPAGLVARGSDRSRRLRAARDVQGPGIAVWGWKADCESAGRG